MSVDPLQTRAVPPPNGQSAPRAVWSDTDVECAVGRPIIILAPPRSFTSVVSAMIGQHPQLYGLPELQMFGSETVAEWWAVCGQASFPMSHGLLRAVAQLRFGAQTPDTIRLAGGWLRRRSGQSTGLVLEELASAVAPRVVVDKSPSTVYDLAFMRRAHAMFPGARFLHLTRHPRAHSESVLQAVRTAARHGPVPQWLLKLASFESAPPGEPIPPGALVDPQGSWFALHACILEFLRGVPTEQQLRVRGEDLLADPSAALPAVVQWLGVRTDADAVAAMMHPERSPYACFGPTGARLGNDANFLQDPVLRPDRATPRTLAGPLPWRADRRPFRPEVVELATSFGYS
jgi:hypothetical protein